MENSSLERLSDAVWHYHSHIIRVGEEAIAVDKPLIEVFKEIEQNSRIISALRVDEDVEIEFLLASTDGRDPFLIGIDLFKSRFNLTRAQKNLGIPTPIVKGASEELKHLRKQIEALFLGAAEAGRFVIYARRTPSQSQVPVDWEEFKYYKIKNWRHGSAVLSPNKMLFDIKVQPIKNKQVQPHLASILHTFNSVRTETRTACIELMRRYNGIIGPGIGMKTQRLTAKVSPNTFRKAKKFLNEQVLHLPEVEQKNVLRELENRHRAHRASS